MYQFAFGVTWKGQCWSLQAWPGAMGTQLLSPSPRQVPALEQWEPQAQRPSQGLRESWRGTFGRGTIGMELAGSLLKDTASSMAAALPHQGTRLGHSGAVPNSSHQHPPDDEQRKRGPEQPPWAKISKTKSVLNPIQAGKASKVARKASPDLDPAISSLKVPGRAGWWEKGERSCACPDLASTRV